MVRIGTKGVPKGVSKGNSKEKKDIYLGWDIWYNGFGDDFNA